MKTLLYKPSQQTGAAIARAEVEVLVTANIRSRCAGEAKRGLGGWLIEGGMADGGVAGKVGRGGVRK